MIETTFTRIKPTAAGACAERRERSPPSLTLNFGELKERYCRIVTAIGSMASGYHRDSQYIDELHYQRTLDALTDQLHEVCADLGLLRSTCSDHLKLKISALLYLLPDEADTELRLTKSLLADLEERPLEPAAASS